MNIRALGIAFVVGTAAVTAATEAAAQAFPSKPLRIFVGYPPGGVTDLGARIVATEMTARLPQPTIVENRVGANGLIAAQAVKNATPDGYSLLYGSAGSFSPLFMKDNPIAAAKELQGVSTVAFGEWFVYVPSSLGVSNLKELAAYAKANPGKVRFGEPSKTNTMLMATLAKAVGGFNFEPIPYKASADTIQAMLNGDAQITINGAPGFEAFIKDGRVKAIATLGKERSAIFPAAAPATEQGVPLDVRFIHGVWTTLGTPRDVVAKLSAVASEGVKSAGASEKIRNVAMVPGGSSPEELVRVTEGEVKFYTDAAALIGFKPQ